MSAYSILMVSLFCVMWVMGTFFMLYVKFKHGDLEMKEGKENWEKSNKFNSYYV